MEEEVEFKWGVMKGIGRRNKDVKFYESFTYGGTEYSLYDSAWFYQNGYTETNIGKIVKLFEAPTNERKAKVVWFFRPIEVRGFLGGIEPRWNELLLASGRGIGLSNVINLEAVIGKCHVICASEDKRNPRPSANELKTADYIFYRTFDVGNKSISKKFADDIGGTKVEFFFNRIKDQRSTNPPSYQDESKKLREQFDVSSSSRIELTKGAGSPSKSGTGTPTSRKASLLNELEKGPYGSPKLNGFTVESGTHHCITPTRRKTSLLNELEKGPNGSPKLNGFTVESGNHPCITATSRKTSLLNDVKSEKGPYENPKLKGFTVESENQPCIQVKDKRKAGSFETSLAETEVDTRPYKKRCILLDDKGSISQKGEPTKREVFGAKASRISENAGGQLASSKGIKTNNQLMEETRRPDVAKRNWFKPLPWEVKLRKAQEAGTLVLLENLDPSYASREVEDLVWSALEEKVEARMIQYSTFSSPLYGKAFVIFKSKMAAENAINELNKRYLITAEGRPVICRRRNLRVPDTSTSFAGHLVLDKLKFQVQREEMRNAVSTSHCSQPNTIEYDLAMQWRELQAKSELWWKALYEKQRKEMNEFKIRLAKPQL